MKQSVPNPMRDMYVPNSWPPLYVEACNLLFSCILSKDCSDQEGSMACSEILGSEE